MLNARELSGRLDNCEIEGVSVTNYGIAIAKMHGILERALSVSISVKCKEITHCQTKRTSVEQCLTCSLFFLKPPNIGDFAADTF